MVDAAAGWVANVLPVLQRAESPPTQSAAISLLNLVFSRAIDMPEFVRQVCTPNVPKFSLALISLSENDKTPLELKVLCLRTLTHMLSLYPNAHRSMQSSLTNLCLGNLKGAAPTPTPEVLRRAAAALFAMVSVTGGKVAAADVWKKNMLGALRAAADSVRLLRGTSKAPAATSLLEHVEILTFPPLPEDPLDYIPIALDRLRCMVALIEALLRYPASRPVPVPIGAIMQLCTMMLELKEDEVKEPVDSAQRVAELAALPEVWKLGAEVLSLTGRITQIHLSPYSSTLLTLFLRQLDRTHKLPSCITFLRCIYALLASCLIPTERQAMDLLNALLPMLDFTLPSSDTGEKVEVKRSKKRARAAYEGDEVFRKQEETIDVEKIVHVCNAVALILKCPRTPMSFRALSVRHLVNILLHLDGLRISEHNRGEVWKAVWSAVEVEWLEHGGVGGIAVNLATTSIRTETARKASHDLMERLELLLHPRLPPLLRNIPVMEILGLQLLEAGEERDLASKLGIDMSIDPTSPIPPTIRASGKQPPDPTESGPVVLPQQMSPNASAEPGPSQPLFMQHTEMRSPAQPRSVSAAPTRATSAEAMDVDLGRPHSVAPPASYGTEPTPSRQMTEEAPAPASVDATSNIPKAPANVPVPSAPEISTIQEEEEVTVTATTLDKGKQKETISTTTSTWTTTYSIPQDDDDDEPMPTINLESDTTEDEEEDEEDEE